MGTLDRNGVEIFYEVEGDGPALILSHGFCATSAMWAGQVDELSRDHTLVRWDLRGHGRSASPLEASAYSEALTIDDIGALLDAVGHQTAVIGGHSLGGYMSLAFCRAHPDRVRGLMLFCTGPGYKSDAGRAEWNRTAEAMARSLEKKGLGALESRSREMAGESHRDAAGLVRAARGMLVQHDSNVIESLERISVPALIVVGEHDKGFLKAGAYMADKISEATHVVVPDAGHAVNIDQPSTFNASVRAFLDEQGL